MFSLDEMLQNLDQKLTEKQQQLERERAFSELANQTFNNNMVAFKHYFPEIYEKYSVYDPDEKFQLLVNPNGTPNIIDYDTGVPFYSEDPESQVQQQVDKAFEHPVITHTNFSYLEFSKTDADHFLHSELMAELGKEYNQVAKALPFKPKTKGKIPGLVIFGVGLGYHILPLTEKINAAYISIFEPNEDYFFASLFTFDWAGYLQLVDDNGACVLLSVGVEADQSYQTFYDRVQQLGPFSVINAFYYQHYPSKAMDDAIKRILENYHEFFMGWGFFDDALIGMAHTLANHEQKLPHINFAKCNSNKYSDFPVFIVANGPSLDNDIQYIKKYQDNALILSCNTATTALIKQGIIPDFHIALERTKETYDFLEAFIPEDFRKKINLLTVNVMYPDVASLFKWAGIGLKGREAGTSLFQVVELLTKSGASGTLGYANPLVGNLALSYAIYLGFKNIYLFGVDNGYVDHDKHHSKYSMYYDDSGEELYVPDKIGEELAVEGNFVDQVYCDQFLNQGRVQMERLLADAIAKEVECFNCSNGARIQGAYPLASSDILLTKSNINKTLVVDYIKTELFEQMPESVDFNDYLYFDDFKKVCTCMIDLLQTPVNDREQAFEQLLKQVRFLQSLKTTQFSHLYFLLEGEALYFNAVLCSVLCSYGDTETAVLPHYDKLKALWCEFLANAPEYYQERHRQLDTHDFKF